MCFNYIIVFQGHMVTTTFKIKKNESGESVQLVEFLSSIHQALVSIFSTT